MYRKFSFKNLNGLHYSERLNNLMEDTAIAFLSSYFSLFKILFTPVLVLNTYRSERNTIASRQKGTTSPDMGLALLTTCLGGSAILWKTTVAGHGN
jgi:hypothetical protein